MRSGTIGRQQLVQKLEGGPHGGPANIILGLPTKLMFLDPLAPVACRDGDKYEPDRIAVFIGLGPGHAGDGRDQTGGTAGKATDGNG